MRKNIFALVAAFSVLMITTFNTAFCADNEDETKVAGKKITMALALDGRELKPLKKDTSDEFFLGTSNNQKESSAKGGKGEAEQTKDDEKGRSTQNLHLGIRQLVELIRGGTLIISEDLKHIGLYFSDLEGANFIEQIQYDNLIRAYKKELEKREGKNPSAIAVLSREDLIMSSTVLKEDSGSFYHTEQSLIRELVKKIGAEGFNNLKIGLYTQNSPCFLRGGDGHLPCIDLIQALISEPNQGVNPLHIRSSAQSALVLYDLIYDDPRFEKDKYRDSHRAIFISLKKSLIEKISKKIGQLKIFGEAILKEKLLPKEQRALFLFFSTFQSKLERDLQLVRSEEIRQFSELPTAFLGAGFHQIQSSRNKKLFLIWSADMEKIQKRPNEFLNGLKINPEIKRFLLGLSQNY